MNVLRSALALVLISVHGCESEISEALIAQGRDFYRGAWCIQCHGLDRKGTTQGPPLRELNRHWTEEKLMEYLRDPPTHVESDSRLKELSGRYSMIMPKFIMEDETRRALAAYLLGTEDSADTE